MKTLLKIKLIALVVFAIAFTTKTQASNNLYEPIADFGYYSSVNCSGNNALIESNFLLEESIIFLDCEKRDFKLSYIRTTGGILKCAGYKYTIYSHYNGSTNVETSGTFHVGFYSTVSSISTTFSIYKHSFENNYTYSIELSYYSPDPHCEPTPGCGISPGAYYSSFVPNWHALPSDRTFTLDASNSYQVGGAVPPGGYPTETKCSGDAMVFTLSQEAAEDLNCYNTTSNGGLYPCSSQYAGLKITKTDASHHPIDQTRFLGTDEWNSAMGNPVYFIEENFFDQYNTYTTKDIPLLPLFDSYMDNNFGFYTLEFEYHSICGVYVERMYVEYGTTYVPTFNFAEALTGGGFAMNQVPTNTSFSNPFVSCQSSSILNLTNVSSNIYSNNPLNIIVERFDNTTGNSDGVIVDITFSNWNAASNVNLRSYAWGDPATQTPTNSYASYYNNWSGWSPFILGLLDPLPYPGLTLNYYDNQDDIYNIRLEYTTVCGTETAEMWFTPTSATCKKGIDEVPIDLNMSIYPNPISDFMNISYYTTVENPKIAIYSLIGQKVYEQAVTVEVFKVNEKLDISSLNKGVYFLVTTGLKGIEKHKIIKK